MSTESGICRRMNRFLSYQLPWEFTDGQLFFHRLPKGDLREARKCSARLAEAGIFPYQPRTVRSSHEIQERNTLLLGQFEVLGWEEGEYDNPFRYDAGMILNLSSKACYAARCLRCCIPHAGDNDPQVFRACFTHGGSLAAPLTPHLSDSYLVVAWLGLATCWRRTSEKILSVRCAARFYPLSHAVSPSPGLVKLLALSN